jgi:hypothetical protein
MTPQCDASLVDCPRQNTASIPKFPELAKIAADREKIRASAYEPRRGMTSGRSSE